MYTHMSLTTGVSCFIFIIFLLFLPQLADAQNDTLLAPPNENLAARWHIEGSMLLGIGLDDHEVGKTTDNDQINISGGGGFGGNLLVGYGITSDWEISAGYTIQNSTLEPQVENAKGNLLRSIIIVNIKYHLPVSSTGLINFGAGAGYYMPGDLDVDMSAVPEGAHNIYGYDSSIGFHLLAEYQGFFNPDFSWIIGMKYYNVSFDLKSAESNGVFVPIDQLPTNITSELSNLDGSGIDLVLGLKYYF